MLYKNYIILPLFFIVYISQQSHNCSAESYENPTLAQHLLDVQNGTDMENNNNRMFDHTTDIFPEDDPILRYVHAGAIRYFQPTDGSMQNGTYNASNKSATTMLHTYKDVHSINATRSKIQLNQDNEYIDRKGNKHSLIGIFDEYTLNGGEKQLFYLFGTIASTKPKTKNTFEPLQGYATFSKN
jgi:hypothetical protein